MTKGASTPALDALDRRRPRNRKAAEAEAERQRRVRIFVGQAAASAAITAIHRPIQFKDGSKTASALPRRQPTAKQAAAWEAVQRLGSQLAAAAELGIPQGSVQSRLNGYMINMGIPGDLPGVAKRGVPVLPVLPESSVLLVVDATPDVEVLPEAVPDVVDEPETIPLPEQVAEPDPDRFVVVERRSLLSALGNRQPIDLVNGQAAPSLAAAMTFFA